MIHQPIEAATADPAAFALTIDRDALVPALALLGRLVERRNTVPILSCVLLEPAEGGLAMTTTNLDTWLTLEVPCDWQAPGRLCLSAGSFVDVIKKAERGATVELALDGDKAAVISGRSRNRLHVTPADDFPIMSDAKEGEEIHAFDVPAAEFAGDLARLSWAMAKDDSRYYLNGVAIERREVGDEEQLAMAATDGHSLAWILRDLPAGAEALPNRIIERGTVDIINRALKDRDATATIGMTASRIVVRTDGLRIASKLIDGTYPDWPCTIRATLGEELQLLALPEIAPRVPVHRLKAATKALGRAPVVEMGKTAVRFSLPDAPEFTALSMLLRDDEILPKGFAYETPGYNDALAYLVGLAEAAELPQFTHENEFQGTVTVIEDRHLVIEDGMVTGALFGRQTSRAGKSERWEDQPDYETLTMRPVKVETVTYDEWEDGAYCVAMPKVDAGMAAAVTIGTPGVDERAVATKDNGPIALDEAAVARLVGEIGDQPPLDLPKLTFLHGRIIARDGIATDGSGRRLICLGELPKVKDGRRYRKMTDREVVQMWNRDKAEVMGILAPCWGASLDEVPAEPAPAKVYDDCHTAGGKVARREGYPRELPSYFTDRTGRNAKLWLAGWDAADAEIGAEAAESAVQRVEAPAALPPEVEGPEIASTVPQSDDLEAIEPEPSPQSVPDEPLAAVFAELEALRERVAKLEAPAANVGGTEAEAETGDASDAIEPHEIIPSRDFIREVGGAAMPGRMASRPARLRIVRRYLAMRAERAASCKRIEELERAHLNAANGNIEAMQQLRIAERRAEDAEFKLSDLTGQLEAAVARGDAEKERADKVDERWKRIVDEKQARIVALENEKIERLSGGKIRLGQPANLNGTAMPAVLRVQAQPHYGGMQ